MKRISKSGVSKKTLIDDEREKFMHWKCMNYACYLHLIHAKQ
jgi:hypothetical protein